MAWPICARYCPHTLANVCDSRRTYQLIIGCLRNRKVRFVQLVRGPAVPQLVSDGRPQAAQPGLDGHGCELVAPFCLRDGEHLLAVLAALL